MREIQAEIVIIGGGLTGLLLARLLQNTGRSVIILEARDRLGGRIHTSYEEGLAPTEMGATWLGKKHTALVDLLEELGIKMFEQVLGERAIYHAISTSPPQLVHLPPNPEPSYRIQGGSSAVIDALARKLNPETIFLKQVVKSVEKHAAGFLLKTENQDFRAPIVVSTLPPHLLVSTIQFSPHFPESLVEIAQHTHTWMGESIKVALSYPTPFWRSPDSSGTIMSNVGPIPEMYDHSNVEEDRFALKGFVNGTYFSMTQEERLALVLNQLEQYYGAQVREYLNYEERVWRHEPFTFFPYTEHVLPHQHNGHPIYQQAFFEGNFYVAGSETASLFPGYMDGAVRSAKWVFDQIESQFM